ncbi:hypothetical protein D910_08137 [Dendroctonus ponderosae]|uniref:RNA (guanine-9-)-methyltransferase domain-containing protein 1 n=1 Tax=Dendroctonus ponderosae TaxID=77166 RepID=U4UKU5_DENPD|nr:hypothetical protein D910_08137 [Dendroctonus ponderosae]
MLNWGRRALTVCKRASGGTRQCSQAGGAPDAGEAPPRPQPPGVLGLAAFTKGDPELEHKLKVIMLETEVMRAGAAPGVHEPPDLGQPAQVGVAERPAEEKKEARRQQFEEAKAAMGPREVLGMEEHAQTYGLAANNIFLRFYDTSINHFYNGRLAKACDFGQKLVLDCGFDRHMSRRENQNAAKQLMMLFSDNRFHKDPFDIHYTSLRPESELTQMLQKIIPTMYEPAFPMNVHEGSYLEVFPKGRLVYLTPHCREEMERFDHDAIYIIGGIVDKLNNEPLSLAKAKREGLQMRKFPLDRYLQWGGGSGKSLTLNQCVRILLDLKESGDWRHALRHVPRRKLTEAQPPRARLAWRPQARSPPSLHHR